MSADATARRRRSCGGCHTCEKRRRKCDEARPICSTCQEGGHLCEGYETRLHWDVGVASRGRFTGAPIPKAEAVPPRLIGRQRDLALGTQNESFSGIDLDMGISATGDVSGLTFKPSSDDQSRVASDDFSMSIDIPLATSRDLQKETLFQQFLTSGSLHLYATTLDHNPLAGILSALCQRSETLYDVCVACQAYLTYGTDSIFYDFYSEALEKYRLHLDHPLRTTDEAIINASLLLCTIGIMQGTPWTLHLHGIERMLDDRAAMSPLDDVEPAFVGAIELMGIMDIPRFCVGRQTPSLNVWRRYRDGKLIRFENEPDSVQSMVGLPKSLLDLLACDDEQLSEEQVLLWPGCQGTLLQTQLWEAYRYTLMILVTENKHSRQRKHETLDRISHFELSLPATEILTMRALSSIDAVFNGVARPDAAGSLLLNAMYFPLFHLSAHIMRTEDRNGHHLQIRQWWERLCEDPFTNTKQAWEIVQSIASERSWGNSIDPEQVARTKGNELGLF